MYGEQDYGSSEGGASHLLPQSYQRSAPCGAARGRPVSTVQHSMLMNAECRRQQKDENQLTDEEVAKLMNTKAHRPYFVYTVTAVQAVVMMMAVSPTFGGSFAAFGVGSAQSQQSFVNFAGEETSQVVTVSKNMWLGPEIVDIIHWGAKFTPCMREDKEIVSTQEAIVEAEQEYGCCTNNNNQCGMMSEDECDGYGGQFSGVGVSCANDNNGQCIQILFPCCYGVQAQCALLTEDHCTLLNGRMHEGSEMCGDVDCLESLCGMGGFMSSTPDQFFRFLTPIFMHIGILHLFSNLSFQLTVGKDLEAVCGFRRLAAMYFISGIGGNVAGSLFGTRYQVSAGASSSLYGLIGVTCVDLFYSWRLVRSPFRQLVRLLAILVVVLGIGTLPFIDNFAHVGGFLVGILSGLVFLPYIKVNVWDTCGKEALRIMAAGGLVFVLLVSFSIFYGQKDASVCEWCQYVNCVPWVSGLCDDS